MRFTEEEKTVRGAIDLFVPLYLLIDLLVSLLTPLALLSIRLGGAATKAAHDHGPGQRGARMCGCVAGMLLMRLLLERRTINRSAHMDHSHSSTARGSTPLAL